MQIAKSLLIGGLLTLLLVGCGSQTITGIPTVTEPTVTYFDSARVYIVPGHNTNALFLYANTSYTDSCQVRGTLWVADSAYALQEYTFDPKTDHVRWSIRKWNTAVSPDSAMFYFTAPGLAEVQIRRGIEMVSDK
jgi:hypothetical protein